MLSYMFSGNNDNNNNDNNIVIHFQRLAVFKHNINLKRKRVQKPQTSLVGQRVGVGAYTGIVISLISCTLTGLGGVTSM